MAKDIYKLEKMPMVYVKTDSKSLKEHLQTTKIIADPRCRVDTARLREMVNLKEIDIEWVPTGLQISDCLTKHGASAEVLHGVVVYGTLDC